MELYAKLLQQRMRVNGMTPLDVARASGLQDETIRAYLRSEIRPSKRSLGRLCMLFGADLATPFEETELAGAAARAVEMTPLTHDRVVLRLELVVPLELATQILGLLEARKLIGPAIPFSRAEVINKVVAEG